MRRAAFAFALVMGCGSAPATGETGPAVGKPIPWLDTIKTRDEELLHIVWQDAHVALAECVAQEGERVHRDPSTEINAYVTFDPVCSAPRVPADRPASVELTRCIVERASALVAPSRELCEHPSTGFGTGSSPAKKMYAVNVASRAARLALESSVAQRCAAFDPGRAIIFRAEARRGYQAARRLPGPELSAEGERCLADAVRAVNLEPFIDASPDWPLMLHVAFFDKRVSLQAPTP
ncbi:MAG: hypothetical protein IPG50_33615 [Myxococcales bacterium]|nr:hypothetical protein [Myxococcales bacterium]